MKNGTRYIGWGLIAFALVICGWIFFSNRAEADGDGTVTDGNFTFKDGELIGYTESMPGEIVEIPSSYDDGGTQVTVTGIDGGVFNGTSVSSVIVPSSVTSVGDQAFQGTTNLMTVEFQGTVSNFGTDVFKSSGVQGVTINSETAVNANTFSGANSLAVVNVSGGSGLMTSFDGCVYGANGTELLYVPPSKSTISYNSGVTSIASGAFSGNETIEQTTIPDTVTTIHDDAFAGCNIAELVIPGTTTTIGSQSNFNPDTIYGNADTAAQYLAQALEIAGMRTRFIVLGNNPGGGSTDPVTPPGTDPVTPPGTDPVTPPGSNPSGGGDSGDDDVAYVEATDPNTGATTTYIVRGDGTVGVVKDTTPKTADGFDTRYFLVIAMALAGVATITLGRSKKLQYVSDNVR